MYLRNDIMGVKKVCKMYKGGGGILETYETYGTRGLRRRGGRKSRNYLNYLI